MYQKGNADHDRYHENILTTELMTYSETKHIYYYNHNHNFVDPIIVVNTINFDLKSLFRHDLILCFFLFISLLLLLIQ